MHRYFFVFCLSRVIISCSLLLGTFCNAAQLQVPRDLTQDDKKILSVLRAYGPLQTSNLRSKLHLHGYRREYNYLLVRLRDLVWVKSERTPFNNALIWSLADDVDQKILDLLPPIQPIQPAVATIVQQQPVHRQESVLTQNQRNLLSCIANGPLATYDIADRLRDSGHDIQVADVGPWVIRQMKALQSLGFVVGKKDGITIEWSLQPKNQALQFIPPAVTPQFTVATKTATTMNPTLSVAQQPPIAIEPTTPITADDQQGEDVDQAEQILSLKSVDISARILLMLHNAAKPLSNGTMVQNLSDEFQVTLQKYMPTILQSLRRKGLATYNGRGIGWSLAPQVAQDTQELLQPPPPAKRKKISAPVVVLPVPVVPMPMLQLSLSPSPEDFTFPLPSPHVQRTEPINGFFELPELLSPVGISESSSSPTPLTFPDFTNHEGLTSLAEELGYPQL